MHDIRSEVLQLQPHCWMWIWMSKVMSVV